MKQIKIFSSARLAELESEVNSWLKSNSQITLVNVSHQIVAIPKEAMFFYTFIVYEG